MSDLAGSFRHAAARRVEEELDHFLAWFNSPIGAGLNLPPI